MSNRDIDSSSENVFSDWARDAEEPGEPAPWSTPDAGPLVLGGRYSATLE